MSNDNFKEVTIDAQIEDKLNSWGIYNFVIEDEAKEHILTALNSKDIERVYIDNENGLCIDFFGDD